MKDYKDYKELLKRNAADLFALDDTLKSLAYDNTMGRPIIRYDRATEALSASELYWCTPAETPPAGLILIWFSGWCLRLRSNNTTLYKASTSTLSAPPEDIQLRATLLLRELDKNRELLATYHIGHFEKDKFRLGPWYDLPEEVAWQDYYGCYSVNYTVTRDGVLGLDGPWDDVPSVVALLGI